MGQTLHLINHRIRLGQPRCPMTVQHNADIPIKERSQFQPVHRMHPQPWQVHKKLQLGLRRLIKQLIQAIKIGE
jgi:hypothetical protein